jgi:hypothetical protein
MRKLLASVVEVNVAAALATLKNLASLLLREMSSWQGYS